MSTLAKTVRVLHELSPNERFARGVKQVNDSTEAAHARVNHNQVQRIRDLYKECFGQSIADDDVTIETPSA